MCVYEIAVVPSSKRVRLARVNGMDNTDSAGCRGVSVLCNPGLIRIITSFLPGFHQRLLDLENANGVTLLEKRKAQQAYEAIMAQSICNRLDDRYTPEQLEALSRIQRATRSLTELAIEMNDQRNLEMVCELRQRNEMRNHPRLRFQHAMRFAASYGRLEMLKRLSEQAEAAEWFKDPWLLDSALQSANVDVVNWVISQYCGAEDTVIQTKTLDKVAKNGALQVLILILSLYKYARLTTDAMDGAAENGHLDIVEYLHESKRRLHSIRNGQSCAKWSSSCRQMAS